jgi:hypothetical protein
MKFRKRFFVVVTFLGILFPTFAQKSTPFRLVLDSPHSAVKRGEDLTVRVTLENTSPRPIAVSESVGEIQSQYLFEVWDSQGNVPPETERARKLKGPVTSSDVIHTLQPGGKLQNEIVLTQLYDISRSGKYTIQVSRVIPKELGGGVAKSNKITLGITD